MQTQTDTPAQPAFEILYNDGSDSVVIADSVSHDDIAEVFHNERHTVSQTIEQALETARLFVAAPDLLEALQWSVDNHDGNTNCTAQQLENCIDKCRAAIAKATGK